MKCHHRLWITHTVGRRRAWRAIISLKKHRRSDGVRRGMLSSPLESTNGQLSLGVTCHHSPWTAHTVGNVGQGIKSPPWIAHTVGRRWAWHAIISFGKHRRSDGVRRGMPSSPLDSTNSRLSSGVTCHHSPWTAHMVGNVGQGIKSPPWTAHTVANIERGMTSPPLHCTHGQQRRAWHDITAL